MFKRKPDAHGIIIIASSNEKIFQWGRMVKGEIDAKEDNDKR